MRTNSRPGGYFAVAASIAALAALTACSSSSGGSGGSSSGTGAAVVTSAAQQTSSAPAPSSPAASASTTAASSSLSGNWSGHYSGTFSGTFTLNWTQSGANLTGTIKLSSNNNEPTNINGSVQNNHIKFGTVGSQAVQYEGTAAGNSMSGTWKFAPVNGASAGGGTWSAAKS